MQRHLHTAEVTSPVQILLQFENILFFAFRLRRISAIGVAERVAAERGEKAGEATVGYQVYQKNIIKKYLHQGFRFLYTFLFFFMSSFSMVFLRYKCSPMM